MYATSSERFEQLFPESETTEESIMVEDVVQSESKAPRYYRGTLIED